MKAISRVLIAVIAAVAALFVSTGTSHAGLDNELSLVDGQDRTLTIQQWDTFLNGVFPLDRNRLTREWFHSGSAVYNVAGGAVWVLSFLFAGWWFGGLETVQKNFHLVIGAIIVISVLPPIVEALRLRLAGPKSGDSPGSGSMKAPEPIEEEALSEEVAPPEPVV